jgi:hypothetical protein
VAVQIRITLRTELRDVREFTEIPIKIVTMLFPQGELAPFHQFMSNLFPTPAERA